MPFPYRSGTWPCHAEVSWSILKCFRMPQSAPTATYDCFTFVFFPPLQLRLNLRMHCVGTLLQSIPQCYFVGGFPQMRVFLSNGKTELHRSGLSPDRHRKIQTRLISASFTWSQDEGTQWNSASTRGEKVEQKKKEEWKKQKRSIQADHHSSLSLG